MKSHWSTIKNKLQHSGVIRLFLDAIGRLGIKIVPYYVVMEGLFLKQSSIDAPELGEYQTGFLNSDEIKKIAAIPGRQESEDDLLRRLTAGQLCFGLKLNNDLSAFTWCNLQEFRVFGVQRAMAQDEAYLFDAYTLLPCRGKGIAPFMRYELYRVLDKFGKRTLYSYSDVFNLPALKFKQKLNARIVELNLYIDIFARYRFNLLIKKFNKS